MVELEYLQSWSLPLLSLLHCQTDRINYKFSGGDWVTGQPKPFFETFASALLAGGKITYKFAKLSRKLKNIGNLSSSTEIH